MSNINLVIEERPADIGNFMVGRLLPFHSKKMVGPFIFIDHMGPANLNEYHNIDIPPHPHIGLSTLTYLFEGSILHKDSLGTEMEIKPGAVNWMTAGRGIVHSERTPEYLRHTDKQLHGLQIWVAMPRELEETAPTFAHIDADKLPVWHEEGVNYKLVAGTALGKTSPVLSSLYLLELKCTEQQTINIGYQLYGETAMYILEGSVTDGGHVYEPKRILVTKENELGSFVLAANTTVYIFGGDPFPEERFIYWNFVASSRELIEKAKQNWLEQTFEPVPGETEFVPLPKPR